MTEHETFQASFENFEVVFGRITAEINFNNIILTTQTADVPGGATIITDYDWSFGGVDVTFRIKFRSPSEVILDLFGNGDLIVSSTTYKRIFNQSETINTFIRQYADAERKKDAKRRHHEEQAKIAAAVEALTGYGRQKESEPKTHEEQEDEVQRLIRDFY